MPLLLASTPRRAPAARLVRVAAMVMSLALAVSTVPVLGAVQAPAPLVSASPRPTIWFRLFLRDGQVFTTVGEFTRVEDAVLLQVPLGVAADGTAAETRTVSIAAQLVDWPKTEAYREAVRRRQFEQTGGDRAYAAFTEDVAATLREVALVADPLERIRRLTVARQRLARWPLEHHGYRADEVAQTLSVVDDLLNGMRVAAGQQAFSLALSASSGPPVPTTDASPLLPAPTPQEMVVQALALAPRIGDPTERLQLLETASRVLAGDDTGTDRRWRREARRQLQRQIAQERRVTRAYARLRTWMLEKTARLLALADVRGLMRLREDVRARDARLQARRPHEVQAMLGTLDARLEQARRDRLRIERWSERRPMLERYASLVSRHVVATAVLPRALEDVKALSGPPPAVLLQAERHLAGARADAGLVSVPDEARAAQQLWTSAQQLAMRALQGRRSAVRTGDLQQAWEASAAAAGALLLLQQLRSELATLLRPPNVTQGS